MSDPVNERPQGLGKRVPRPNRKYQGYLWCPLNQQEDSKLEDDIPPKTSLEKSERATGCALLVETGNGKSSHREETQGDKVARQRGRPRVKPLVPRDTEPEGDASEEVEGHSRSSDPEQKEFDVHKVLDDKVEHGVLKYLIHWKRFTKEESTWEKVENLANCKNKLAAYLKKKAARTPLNDFTQTLPEDEPPKESAQKAIEPEEDKEVVGGVEPINAQNEKLAALGDGSDCQKRTNSSVEVQNLVPAKTNLCLKKFSESKGEDTPNVPKFTTAQPEAASNQSGPGILFNENEKSAAVEIANACQKSTNSSDDVTTKAEPTHPGSHLNDKNEIVTKDMATGSKGNALSVQKRKVGRPRTKPLLVIKESSTSQSSTADDEESVTGKIAIECKESATIIPKRKVGRPRTRPVLDEMCSSMPRQMAVAKRKAGRPRIRPLGSDKSNRSPPRSPAPVRPSSMLTMEQMAEVKKLVLDTLKRMPPWPPVPDALVHEKTPREEGGHVDVEGENGDHVKGVDTDTVTSEVIPEKPSEDSSSERGLADVEREKGDHDEGVDNIAVLNEKLERDKLADNGVDFDPKRPKETDNWDEKENIVQNPVEDVIPPSSVIEPSIQHQRRRKLMVMNAFNRISFLFVCQTAEEMQKRDPYHRYYECDEENDDGTTGQVVEGQLVNEDSVSDEGEETTTAAHLPKLEKKRGRGRPKKNVQ